MDSTVFMLTFFMLAFIYKINQRLLWDTQLPTDSDAEYLARPNQFVSGVSPNTQNRHEVLNGQKQRKLVIGMVFTH